MLRNRLKMNNWCFESCTIIAKWCQSQKITVEYGMSPVSSFILLSFAVCYSPRINYPWSPPSIPIPHCKWSWKQQLPFFMNMYQYMTMDPSMMAHGADVNKNICIAKNKNIEWLLFIQTLTATLVVTDGRMNHELWIHCEERAASVNPLQYMKMNSWKTGTDTGTGIMGSSPWRRVSNYQMQRQSGAGGMALSGLFHNWWILEYLRHQLSMEEY